MKASLTRNLFSVRGEIYESSAAYHNVLLFGLLDPSVYVSMYRTMKLESFDVIPECAFGLSRPKMGKNGNFHVIH